MVAEHIVCAGCRRIVVGHISVVGDAVLLTRDAVRDSKLQVVDGVGQRLKKFLLGNIVCQCHRREGAPLLAVGEAAGAVAAYGGREHVAVHQGVVHAAVVREQRMALVDSGYSVVYLAGSRGVVGVILRHGFLPILIVVAGGEIDGMRHIALYLLVIVGIDGQQSVVELLGAVFLTAAALVVGREGSGGRVVAALASRQIEGARGVQADVGEEVQLVVYVKIADEAPGVGFLNLCLQDADGIFRRSRNRGAVVIGRAVVAEEAAVHGRIGVPYGGIVNGRAFADKAVFVERTLQ